ncbi:MAG: hypothetical protein QOD36_663, partial [Mycobacterium sp.]|nr:hypothetical protein [Mycobacterium sp.]
ATQGAEGCPTDVVQIDLEGDRLTPTTSLALEHRPLRSVQARVATLIR